MAHIIRLFILDSDERKIYMADVKEVLHEEKLYSIYCTNYHSVDGPLCRNEFWMTTKTTENKELSQWPQLIEDGKFNTDYLEEAGTYFEEHMAFRLQMLTANSAIWGKIFHTSTTDQVIVGKDDWLYYGGTVNDYTGRDLLSDRELYDVVYNLSLVQDFVEKNGSQFLLAVVPNKNTLYGDNMPYYYQKGTDSNLDRLNKLLEQNNIHFIDLKKHSRMKKRFCISRETAIGIIKAQSWHTTRCWILSGKSMRPI